MIKKIYRSNCRFKAKKKQVLITKVLLLFFLLTSNSFGQTIKRSSSDTLGIVEIKNKFMNSSELYRNRMYKTNTSEKFDKASLKKMYYYKNFFTYGFSVYDTIQGGIYFDCGMYDRCRQNLYTFNPNEYFDLEFSSLPLVDKECKNRYCSQTFFMKVDYNTYKKMEDSFSEIELLFLFNIKNPQQRTIKNGKELNFCENPLYVIPTYNLRVFLYNKKTNEIYYDKAFD